ncbi:unnamed protein product [Adineta steineri]|uniref:Uncharacterized protein n=2 Tax=Adineta steineri TaxID=433720 RepID=A0A813VLI9_9BILA|nr:unnamed protein product [Adineta steineri]CAF4025358.1 unnamed protein product [Adineta steineri]
MATIVDQSQLSMTFEEKIHATILSQQKRTLNLPAVQRKRKKISIVPVGLSSTISDQNIENIIKNLDNYLFDDVMLLVWCKRTTFYNSEFKNDDQSNKTSPFFRQWILLYLKKPDQVLSTHLNTIPKYGGWGDLKTLYSCADHMKSRFSTEFKLLENLQGACVKMIGDQLKHDYQIISDNQSDENSNTEEVSTTIKNLESISNCAKDAPRISNNNKTLSTSKIMAKEIALYLQSLSNITVNNDEQSTDWKGYAYENYRSLISTICQMLEKKTSMEKETKLMDRPLFCTRKKREELLAARPSSRITNPEPQPGVPCTLKDLEPLLEHLSSNKPGPSDDNQPIVFPRGTIMSGGRLDLCKQVVGPQGVQPLLDAMKHSTFVTRLLLGNNIVGLPGAQAISEYIRSNSHSNIDTWYIACNKFDSECISMICDALGTDTKVKVLWLKRNPILADGAVHLDRMLTTNNYLQILDLYNTGLFDRGCEILFNALKNNSSLKHLYMDSNGLTAKSGQILRLHFEQKYNHLETLFLSCNSLGDAGTQELAVGLKHDQCLKSLSLSSNCLGFDGIKVLVDNLISNTTLQQLDLGYMKSTTVYEGLNNIIKDDSAAEISRLLQFNHYIRSIDLTMNSISEQGLLQLRDALKGNQTLTTLKGLTFKRVRNKILKQDIKTLIERNQIVWGKQELNANADNTTNLCDSDYLKQGQQLNNNINYPEHIIEIISHYRVQ